MKSQAYPSEPNINYKVNFEFTLKTYPFGIRPSKTKLQE